MLRWAFSGGNFIASWPTSASVPGYTGSGQGGFVSSTAPPGALDTYAFLGSSFSTYTISTENIGGPFTTVFAGKRYYSAGNVNNNPLITFKDALGNIQCDVRMNAIGQLFFTRNGTPIGSTSALSIPINAWTYVEFSATVSNSGTGTCEARINGVVVVSSGGLTNAVNTNGISQVVFTSNIAASYGRDMYVVDAGTGHRTSYLGDVNVVELFANGAGVNQAWTPNVGPFTLTSVNGSGVYQGTITGGASNAYQGYNFNVTGFVNGANNVTGVECTASSATSITLAATTVTETHAGSAAFECIVEIGINKLGTRPNGDVAYISSNTPGVISDFAHQPLSLSGIIEGVIHMSYARKDDAGTRQVAQVCLSSGTTEVSTTISLGNNYQYYLDILEQDPNTTAQWTVSGLNAATFGVKEIT